MNDDEKPPGFRPRMGRRAPRPAEGLSLRKFLLARVRYASRRASRGARASIAIKRSGEDSRRVMVKTHVVRMTAHGAKAASLHLGYIQRDGVEEDGSPGRMYGADGPVRAEVFEEPRPGERHQFRIIFSPDDGRDLELTDYVRRVLARVERDVGRKLEWAAVNHYNTDHPHAHVVVRGVDREGQEVRFDRSYVSNGMRWRAEEIATEELGPRPEFEIRRAYAREVSQERFTSLDRELERRANDGRVTVRSAQSRGCLDEATILGRLQQLQKMGLAVRPSPVEWELTAGWKDTLRALGTRGDILKQMHAAITGDPGRWHAVGPGQPLPDGYGGVEEKILVGRVAAKGLADELRGTFYAVLETPTGTAYHVAIGPRTTESIRAGDLVTFQSKPARAVGPIDLHIAEVARSHEGVYAVDPAASQSGDGARAAGRLRELERLGLVTPRGAGHWSVPADLLTQLQERHQKEAPRRRLFVQKQPLPLHAQVSYQGPVWLDRVDPRTLAPHGLGAEVARALDGRREVLRELGIDPDDKRRLPRLLQLERELVAEQFAKRSRQARAAIGPQGFHGRAQEFVAPGGASYAIVSDGQGFFAVRMPKAQRWHGKAVTLTRDAKGRPVLREGPDRGRE